MHRVPVRLPRRTFVLRSAVTGAAVVGSALVGPLAATRTVAAAAPVTLVFNPWAGWPAYAGPHWGALIQVGLNYFESQNPGLKVVAGGAYGPAPNAGAAGVLAGAGPDIWQGGMTGSYRAGTVAANLRPYLQRDNIPLSTWSPGQMFRLETASGLWGLPTYVHVDIQAVNLSKLDDLGLPYPSPDWTYQEAEKYYRGTTYITGGQRNFGYAPTNSGGTAVGQGFGSEGEMAFPVHYWGGAVQSADDMRCVIDQPSAYQGIAWYQQLYWDHVATPHTSATAGSIQSNATFMDVGSNWVPVQAQLFAHNIKWQYLPPPAFPNGRFSFEYVDAYFMNAYSHHPEQAWTLMKFLTAEPWWQRFNFRYLLRTPGVVSMWDEWVSYVEAAAPPLRGKSLQYYQQAAASWGRANGLFKYNDGTMDGIIDGAISSAFKHKQDLSAALRVAAQQVNAAQEADAAAWNEAAATDAVVAKIERSHGTETFPTPPVQGLGSPATLVPAADVVVKGNVYTVVGSGQGVTQTTDGLTFGCLPWTAVKGDFTCRVLSIGPVAGVAVRTGAKVGLMARAALSSQAADASVAVSLDRGIHTEGRTVAGMKQVDQTAGLTPGLLQPVNLLTSTKSVQKNYLLKPVWLRLVQRYNTWYAYSSLDGRTWLKAGSPWTIAAAGAWVGIFVTPHDPDVKHKIVAVFDQVSFTPARFYQIG